MRRGRSLSCAEVRRSGFTLVETVVALSIVVSLSIAAIEFTLATTKSAAAREVPRRREALTRSLFLSIDDAILCFETVLEDDPPRIRADEDSLSLRTRDSRWGGCVKTWAFDRARRVVTIEETPFSKIGKKTEFGEPRRSIGAIDVDDFSVRFEPRSRILEVTLSLLSDRAPTTDRRWVIP